MSGVSRFGWDRVRRLLDRVRPEMERAQKQSLMLWGLKAEKTAVLHIRNQDLGWKALNAQYQAAKVRKGLSELTLVATSSYVQSITSWVDGDTVLAGVKKTAKNKDGEELGNIGFWLEKDRPLWKPTFDETMAWHYKNNTPQMIFYRNIRQWVQ